MSRRGKVTRDGRRDEHRRPRGRRGRAALHPRPGREHLAAGAAAARVRARDARPGEKTTVSFTLDRSDFGFYDNRGKFVVEPGRIDVYAGNSSDAELTQVVHGEPMRRTRRRARPARLARRRPPRAPPGPRPARRASRRCGPRATRTGSAPRRRCASTVWHTLDDGELTEVYYPDLGTPAVRDVQLVVTDGRTFADRERQDTEHVTRAGRPAQPQLPPGQHRPRGPVPDHQDLHDRPVARRACSSSVRFRALTRRPLQVYVLHDPNLSNAGDDDVGATGPGGALLASDAKAAQRARREARLHRDVERLPRRERRLDRPRRRLPDGLALRGEPRRATSCRPRARRSPAAAAAGR